jgi:hypothetical protein
MKEKHNLLRRLTIEPGTIPPVQDEQYEEMIREIQDLFYPPEEGD